MSGGSASSDSFHKELGVVLHGFYRVIRNILNCAEFLSICHQNCHQCRILF
jgi:hypothetical protein